MVNAIKKFVAVGLSIATDSFGRLLFLKNLPFEISSQGIDLFFSFFIDAALVTVDRPVTVDVNESAVCMGCYGSQKPTSSVCAYHCLHFDAIRAFSAIV